MWFQCSTDIFFIDWEKPKGRMVSIDSSKMAPESSLKAAPVSIWRTYFVANEWNEIQVSAVLNCLLYYPSYAICRGLPRGDVTVVVADVRMYRYICPLSLAQN